MKHPRYLRRKLAQAIDAVELAAGLPWEGHGLELLNLYRDYQNSIKKNGYSLPPFELMQAQCDRELEALDQAFQDIHAFDPADFASDDVRKFVTIDSAQ